MSSELNRARDSNDIDSQNTEDFPFLTPLSPSLLLPQGSETQEETIRRLFDALEVVFVRNRQLRDIFATLLETMPPIPAEPESQSADAGTQSNDMGPSHAGILLTNAARELGADSDLDQRIQRLRSIIPAPARQGLEDFEARSDTPQARDSAVQAPARPSRSSRANQRHSPPLPDITVPPRYSWDALQSMMARSHRATRNTTTGDSAATTLGRRVAARTASQAASTQPERSDQVASTLAQLEQVLRSRTSEIARDLENITSEISRQRPRLADSRERLREDDGVRPTDGDATQNNETQFDFPDLYTYLAMGDIGVPPPANSASVSPPPGPRTARLLHGGRSLAGSRLIAGLPYPDNTSNPPGNVRSTETSSMMDRNFSYENYYTRSRLNGNERGQVNPLNDPDGSGFAQRHLPRPREEQDQLQGLPVSTRAAARMSAHGTSRGAGQSPEMIRRRRGWARLDADGNEISTDEEDELERTRARSRVHTQQSIASSAHARTLAEVFRTRAGSSFVPITRTSIAHPFEDVSSVVRVRINSPNAVGLPHNILTTHPSGDEVMSVFGSSIPYCVDPLPTPLADMVPSTPQRLQASTRSIKVQRHASLAGR